MKEKAPIIEVTKLIKNYGDLPVFNKVSISVNQGSCTGLVGPNGSGKTTLFKCLLGFTGVTAGQVSLFGDLICKGGTVDHGRLLACRKRIGYVPEENVFYEHLSPKEYLQLVASVLRIPEDIQNIRITALLREFKLERWTERMIATLSEGNRQRLSIAAAFVQGPELGLLDEPLKGLDPSGRHYCLKLFSRFVSETSLPDLALGSPGTLLISSHLLGDLERVCSDVIILNHDGQVVIHDSLAGARDRLAEDADLEDVYLAVVEGEDQEKEKEKEKEEEEEE